MRQTRVLLLLAVLFISLVPVGVVAAEAPSANDLVAAVNDLRSTDGLATLDLNASLMEAAQTQAEYLASFYDTNYPSAEAGHVGENGSYARDRAVAAGYNLTSGMNVIENWAGGNSATTIAEVISDDWGDASHMANLLHPDGVAIGAGVAESEGGALYFVINIGVLYGTGSSASSSSSGVYSTVPTTAVTAAVALVQVATSLPDGSIIHVVKSGEALWNIAAAYDKTVDELLELNYISEDVITVGQEIVIQGAYTATPTPLPTSTPQPPTRTPVPARTIQPSDNQSDEPAADDNEEEDGSFLGLDRQTMGLALILICGAGLALVVLGTISKGKEKEAKKQGKNEEKKDNKKE